MKDFWERAKKGEKVICNDANLDLLCERFKDDEGPEASLFFGKFVTIPNPNRCGLLDQYIGWLKEK